MLACVELSPQGRWKLAALGAGSFRLPRGLFTLSQRRARGGRGEEGPATPAPSPAPSLRRGSTMGSTMGSELGSVWGSDFPEVEAREREEEEGGRLYALYPYTGDQEGTIPLHPGQQLRWLTGQIHLICAH